MTRKKNKCYYCGKPSKRYMFAAFVCDSENCIEKAMEARGGPGGHIKKKIIAGR